MSIFSRTKTTLPPPEETLPGRTSSEFVIAPGSGSGDLAGITGTGSMRIDADGTHRVLLDYDLPG